MGVDQSADVFVCSGCEKTKQSSRLPRNWKRLGEEVFCPQCWKERYCLRAITVPVAGPVDCSWDELREKLKESFSATTCLANWAIRELAKADVVRTPDMEKLPPRNPVYLYPGARQVVPQLPSSSVIAVLHAVEGKYAAERYEVIWLCSRSLPSFRYPVPYPVHNNSWSLEQDENGSLIVSVPLVGGRVKLRLRGGRQFYRQRVALLKCLQGRAVKGELSLYLKRVASNSHRPGVETRDSGGQKVHNRLMCKMCLWLPKEGKVVAPEGTIYVRTGEDCLLYAINEKRERIWYLNYDHVRRWVAEHSAVLLRLSQDQKYEERPVASFQSRREWLSEKYRRRMDAACHMASSALVNYAVRNRFAQLLYNDSVRSFCPAFPYFKLKQYISQKCDAAGIAFIEQPKRDFPEQQEGLDEPEGNLKD